MFAREKRGEKVVPACDIGRKRTVGKRPSVRTRSLWLPGASKTLDFEMPPDSPDRDTLSHHTPEVQDCLDDALLAAAAAHSSGVAAVQLPDLPPTMGAPDDDSTLPGTSSAGLPPDVWKAKQPSLRRKFI